MPSRSVSSVPAAASRGTKRSIRSGVNEEDAFSIYKRERKEEEEKDEEEDRERSEQEERYRSDEDEEEVELATVASVSRHKRDLLRPYINNVTGLRTKLEEIALPSEWPWIERFTVEIPAIELEDVNDNLQREALFYQSTLKGVKIGMAQMDQAHIPYVRPADYYAEMLKPDSHMDRVKDALIREKSRITAVSLRKKQQESRLYSKAMQVAKLQQKQAEKKAHMDGLKQRQNEVKASEKPVSEHSTVPGIDEAIRVNKEFDKQKVQRKNFKRVAKDAKYGFGGKKKRVKSNDSASTRDMSDFRSSKNRSGFGGMSDAKPKRGQSQAPFSVTRGGRSDGRDSFHSREDSRGRRGGRGGRGGGRGDRGQSVKPSRSGKTSRQATTARSSRGRN